jgi:hypothetical protein
MNQPNALLEYDKDRREGGREREVDREKGTL